MTRVSVAHTADLDAQVLAQVRALLDAVFGEELDETDWEHALGGVHALIWDDTDLIGHASVVQRRLLHGGRALRCGYVEGVAVLAEHRRRGHAGQMMDELERPDEEGYVFVLPGTATLDLSGQLACDWRDGDVW